MNSLCNTIWTSYLPNIYEKDSIISFFGTLLRQFFPATQEIVWLECDRETVFVMDPERKE